MIEMKYVFNPFKDKKPELNFIFSFQFRDMKDYVDESFYNQLVKECELGSYYALCMDDCYEDIKEKKSIMSWLAIYGDASRWVTKWFKSSSNDAVTEHLRERKWYKKYKDFYKSFNSMEDLIKYIESDEWIKISNDIAEESKNDNVKKYLKLEKKFFDAIDAIPQLNKQEDSNGNITYIGKEYFRDEPTKEYVKLIKQDYGYDIEIFGYGVTVSRWNEKCYSFRKRTMMSRRIGNLLLTRNDAKYTLRCVNELLKTNIARMKTFFENMEQETIEQKKKELEEL